MTEPTTCGLCRSTAPLRQSHIFPKFVVRWLRDTSATGKFRSTSDMRRRHQDGLKIPLLCSDCEQRFSDHEKWFAERVFRPKMDGTEGHPDLQHPSLLPFVVSVAWRAAMIDKDRLAGRYPRHAKAIQRSAEAWRRYLLDPKLPHGHHCFFPLPDAIYVVDGAERVNWYLQRSTDLSTMLVHHRPIVWWKIPGFAGISSFGGHAVPGAAACVVSTSGAGAAWESGGPQVLVDLLMSRAADTSAQIDAMPDDQWAVIDRDYRKNFDEWADGPAARAAELDYLNSHSDDPTGRA